MALFAQVSAADLRAVVPATAAQARRLRRMAIRHAGRDVGRIGELVAKSEARGVLVAATHGAGQCRRSAEQKQRRRNRECEFALHA